MSAAAAISLLVRLNPDTTVNFMWLSSRLVHLLVDRLAVGSEGERVARTADRSAIVLRAAVIPRPGPRRHFPVLLRHLPRRFQRLGVFDDHRGFHHRVAGLVHARRDAGRVAEDETRAIDDDVVVARFLQATGLEDERVAFPAADGCAGVGAPELLGRRVLSAG